MTHHYPRETVDGSAETRRPEPPPRPKAPRDWGPLVAVTGASLGVLWLVVGLVIVARTGIPTALDMLDEVAEVGPFAGNNIAAALALLAGATYLTIGTQRQATTAFGVGLASVVFGLVWFIEPAAFGDVLGINRATATVALVSGGVATLVGAIASETLFRRSR